jgi:hypothetical protein
MCPGGSLNSHKPAYVRKYFLKGHQCASIERAIRIAFHVLDFDHLSQLADTMSNVLSIDGWSVTGVSRDG